MEQLHYHVEDSTLAELLGEHNFSSKESAVLELVKNAYDAGASDLSIEATPSKMIIKDNGAGMSERDIRGPWMHVGKSEKGYKEIDRYGEWRVVSGSKGVGRFALARLGSSAKLVSMKTGEPNSVVWETDWNSSSVALSNPKSQCGTTIEIEKLRERWGKQSIRSLSAFLSRSYNDNSMKITIRGETDSIDVSQYFSNPKLGYNCLSIINIEYDSRTTNLTTTILSDEFSPEVQELIPEISINMHAVTTCMCDEIDSIPNWDVSSEELKQAFQKIGSFTGQLFFNVPQRIDKSSYKHGRLPEPYSGGVILYRNAFSISSYEGKKDWLGLGKRARKSPAAATHPTGSWRVKENQLSGKITIDKNENSSLVDLSNRQGLREDLHYQLFLEIILCGIKCFERYRQSIIRKISSSKEEKPTSKPIVRSIISGAKDPASLSLEDGRALRKELREQKREEKQSSEKNKENENRHRYDVRILNALATLGLKAASKAHELHNQRNAFESNCTMIENALKRYGFWDSLTSAEMTRTVNGDVPRLLAALHSGNMRIVSFIDTLLEEVETEKFSIEDCDLSLVMQHIKSIWEEDYANIRIRVDISDISDTHIPEDAIQVIFDNLILNTIQQNPCQEIDITIQAFRTSETLQFQYSDNGKGLDKRYKRDPMKILEVHETSRNGGHGLGMWMVNNTINYSEGKIIDINGDDGFTIVFYMRG